MEELEIIIFGLSSDDRPTLLNFRDRGAIDLLNQMSSSSPAHYSPLLDISLSNYSPSRSIFGYSHPAPASRPA
jgi:hypothetical protein